MQIAKVTVLHKKGDTNDFSLSRPISILPILSKGLEKIILRRLSIFFEKRDIISPAQFGFRKQKSTEYIRENAPQERNFPTSDVHKVQRQRVDGQHHDEGAAPCCVGKTSRRAPQHSHNARAGCVQRAPHR